MQSLKHALKGLWSLAIGLKITGVELAKPRITVHYPRQEVDNLASYRGHIELVPADEDPSRPRCIVCLRCADACPSGCIRIRMHVEGAEAPGSGNQGLALGPDLTVPGSVHLLPPPEKIVRVLERFDLNYSMCSLCGLCVQGCPVGAIRFSRDVYMTGTRREDLELELLGRLRDKAGAARATREAAGAGG